MKQRKKDFKICEHCEEVLEDGDEITITSYERGLIKYCGFCGEELNNNENN